jgi:hypothetical protein
MTATTGSPALAAASRFFGSPPPLMSGGTGTTSTSPGGTATVNNPNGTRTVISPGGTQTVYTTTITPPSSFIPPRVGGGTSEQDQWTGGTMLTRVTVKATLAATRPAKFSDRDKVEIIVTKGLPPAQHLYQQAGGTVNGVQMITLSDWIKVVEGESIKRGFESVFNIYDAVRQIRSHDD